MNEDGPRLIARIAMIASMAIVAGVHFMGWRDEAGDVLFLIALLFLTAGALAL